MPDFIEVVYLGEKPDLLLSNMDGQLEAVRQEIRDVKGKIAKTEQNLAEHAHNAEKEKSFLDLLLSLNNQLSGLQEEKNILLRHQAPSKPYLQLAHTDSPVFTPCCTPFVA